VSESKRRLPVLKQTPEEEQGEAPRPPWHWAGFGAAATVAAWLPLLYVAEVLEKRLLDARFAGLSKDEVRDAVAALPSSEQAKTWLIVLGLPVVGFVVGAVFGGYVVGRWGGDRAGAREAAAAGAIAAAVVTVLSACSGGGVSWVYLALAAVAAGTAALGGKLGVRRRRKAMTPNIR
jgi:MFS family permease